MANNPYFNHVQTADGTTIMDIRDTTATPGGVVRGATFYGPSGAQQTGTLGPFAGATGATGGSDGLVPAPAAGEQGYVLMGSGDWEVPPNARLDDVTMTVTNVSGAYSGTVSSDSITASSKAVILEIGDPSVFRDKITVTPSAGMFTVTCQDVVGTTTLKISFMKQVQAPEEITSTEFDILNNRLLAVENVETTQNVTITAGSWTLVSGLYTYVWESDLVTANCGFDVRLLDGVENAGIEDFNVVKVSGGLKFTTDEQPTGSLPVEICVINCKADDIEELTGSIDIPLTIPANGWSNSSPYTYAYTSQYITENSGVTYDFSSANENTEVSYLDIERTSTGVLFTAPVKPTSGIAIILHVDNSTNANITGVDARQVATDAISGAANVQEALASIENRLTRVMALTSATKYGNVKTRLTYADKIPYLTYDYDGGNYYAPLGYKLDSYNVARFWGVRGRNSTDHFIQIDNNGLSVSVIDSNMTTTTITSECSNIVLHY